MPVKQNPFTRISQYFTVQNMGYKTPCWVWHGGKSDRGYGKCWDGEKRMRFHIYTYLRFNGPIPVGLELDHLCRIRACGNPSHLEPVTHQENIRRGQTGIVNRSKTHCKYGHEFTPENTRLTTKGRSCRQCVRDWYNANLKSTDPALKYWGRKLLAEQVQEFLDLRKAGLSLTEIAKRLPVSRSTLHRIEKGKSYVGVAV